MKKNEIKSLKTLFTINVSYSVLWLMKNTSALLRNQACHYPFPMNIDPDTSLLGVVLRTQRYERGNFIIFVLNQGAAWLHPCT